MQLAKNLYLSFDKTLSRKLQEAVLTTVLEQELSKQEMMELYLNVIEYGPGIYGIEAAAKHYFDTIPAQLSLGQALYLGSILPNPAQFHFDDKGNMGTGWRNYLGKLMRIALKIGRISEPELDMALAEEIRFGVASTLGGAPTTGSISEHGVAPGEFNAPDLEQGAEPPPGF
jgi:membrane peptidoglycan carboxypeptidase